MKTFTYYLEIVPTNHLIRKVGSKLVLLLAFIFLLPILANAERVYPDMSVSISSGGSDYKLIFDYSGSNVVSQCAIPTGHEFRIFKNTDVFDDAEEVISASGRRGSGVIEYVAGPNNTGEWGLRFAETGTFCNLWVWSGYPVASNEDDKPSGYSVLT